MIKLNNDYIAFLEKNARDLLRFVTNGMIEKTKSSVFLDNLYDWIDENGFDDNGYYNSKGVKAQSIYDFVFNS